MTKAFLPGEIRNFDTVYVAAYDENSGYLWCGTSKGLFSYQTMSEDWEQYILPLGDPPVLSIGITDQDIWVEGGEPGFGVRMLFKGNPNYGAFNTSSPGELAQAWFVNWRGEREARPEDYPQYFINQNGMIFRNDGVLLDMKFHEYELTSTIDDGRGYSWLCFYGYGVGRADKNTLRIDLFPEGPAGSKVKAMLMDKKEAWLGGKEISRWQRGSNTWEYYLGGETTGLFSGEIKDIYTDGDKLYFATALGLSIMDKKSGRFHTLNSLDNLWDSQVTALDGDSMEIWLGTAQGVNFFRLKDDKIFRVGDDQVRRIFVNDISLERNFVWVGAYEGLYLHDRKIGDWTYVSGTPELQGYQVNKIQSGVKEVWIARDSGIEVFDKDIGKWSAYQNIFLNNHRALSILAGDSLVWVGTDGGLYKLNRPLNKWTDFTTEDGLPSDTVYTIQQEGDYLWLGTSNGLCRFYWNNPYRLD